MKKLLLLTVAIGASRLNQAFSEVPMCTKKLRR